MTCRDVTGWGRAAFLVLLIAGGVFGRSATVNAQSLSARGDGGDAGADIVLGFEERSNRLSPFDTGRLDRLAARMTFQDGQRLLLLAPTPADPAARTFVTARMATVEQELSRRGLTAERVRTDSPVSSGYGGTVAATLVLRLVPKDLPRTPIERRPVAEPPVQPPSGMPLPSMSAPVDAPMDAVVPPAPAVATAALASVPPSSTAPVSLTPPAPPASLPAPPASSPPPDPILPPPAATASSIETPPATAVAPPAASQSPLATAPVPAAPIVEPPVVVEETWTAAVGKSLRDVLRTWGDRAGWTIVWQSDRDYPVDAQATFTGDFATAASHLLDGFATAVPAPYAHFYKGNQVLLVLSGEGR